MAKLMVIDDDVALATDLVEALRAAGHEAEYRDDTDGAEGVLAANPPELLVLDVVFPGNPAGGFDLALLAADPPELLVLDVVFPGNPAGGFDLARRIRQTDGIRDLPVILLTNVNEEFTMDFSSDDIDPDWMPVQAFLEKPVDLTKLLAKVDEMLGDG
jgi:DNA-binding response OmpR family regulator